MSGSVLVGSKHLERSASTLARGLGTPLTTCIALADQGTSSQSDQGHVETSLRAECTRVENHSTRQPNQGNQ